MSSFKIQFKNFRNKSHLFAILLIVALVFSSSNLWNFVYATDITGVITTDTTWTEAGSPYVLTGNVLVDEGTTLTIEPRTTVNLGSYYIQVDGTLIARGNPSNLININSGQIRFTVLCQNWSESSDSGCIIENALFDSSYIKIEKSTVKINNCLLTNTDVDIIDGDSVFSNNTVFESIIRGNAWSLLSLNAKIVNNSISAGGIVLQHPFGDGSPLIENNFITSNTGGAGILITSSSLSAIIRNNTITNNSIGIHLDGVQQSQTILYNNIYQNLNYNLKSDSSIDINATYNYWGTTNSTLINQTIFDFYDDFPLGVVDFIPLLEHPNPDAPTIAVRELLFDAVISWNWADNTIINSVASGDVDADGSVEIITGGYYFDGTRDVAQLVILDGSSLNIEQSTTWYITNDTRINSIQIANLDEDNSLEIVTAGYYNDNFHKNAQLMIWDGSSLNVEGSTAWQWIGDTEINSVAIADIEGDTSLELVTGGYYNDGFRDVAQLIVWDGSTVWQYVQPLRYTSWYWEGNTRINSVDIKNVDSDAALEIVTGGYYYDEQKIAQLVLFNGLTLSLENIATWYWTSDTEINTVKVANIDEDNDVEIISGGYFNDNTRDVAQLIVWDKSLQTVENLVKWYWNGDTQINSIGIGDVDTDGFSEIVTGGFYNDLTRNVAQLVVWEGSTLSVEYLSSWYWTGDTKINSVTIDEVDKEFYTEMVTGGSYYDGAQDSTQLTIWEIS